MANLKGKTRARLTVEGAKLEGIASSLGEGVNIVGPDYRVYYQNKQLADRFGDLRGKLCYERYVGRASPARFVPR